MLFDRAIFLLIPLLLWQSQANPLQGGPPPLAKPNKLWPQPPFQYAGGGRSPYVLYFNVLGDAVNIAFQSEAYGALERFPRTFSALRQVGRTLTIRSRNFALTFDPFADGLDSHDAYECAEQFTHAQKTFGSRAALGYCHKGNSVFGTIRLVIRSTVPAEALSPWLNPPFSDKTPLHGQQLLFYHIGYVVKPVQRVQFLALLHDAETRTQRAARAASSTTEQNHHVSVTSPRFQFDLYWSGIRSGDELLYAFYAFLQQQYRHGMRCVGAHWQDPHTRHIGKFTISEHGQSPRLAMAGAGVNGTETAPSTARRNLGSG